jgi:hypothetical protein
VLGRALAAEPADRFLDANSLRAAFYLALSKAPPRPTAQPPRRPHVVVDVSGDSPTARWNPVVGLRRQRPETSVWRPSPRGLAA